MRVCKVEGCLTQHEARGYCQKHYQRMKRGVDITADPVKHKTCTVIGCHNPHNGKGLCKKHYMRFSRGLDVDKKSQQEKSDIERFVEKVDKTGECWIWTGGKIRNGYGSFTANGEKTIASRFAYKTYVGDIPEGLHVCHTCDNPSCVNPHHLWVGTRSENMLDMIAKGRGHKINGEKSPNSKLTDKTVLKIRWLYPRILQKELGLMFGVSPQTISSVLLRKRWKHV